MHASAMLGGGASIQARPASARASRGGGGASAAAAAAARPLPLPTPARTHRLAALRLRVRLACAYESPAAGTHAAARLLSMPPPPQGGSDAAARPRALSSGALERLRRLLPPLGEEAADAEAHQNHDSHHLERAFEEAVDEQWRSAAPDHPSRNDTATLAAADLLRASALLRLHPRRDPRAARALQLASRAVVHSACSPLAVARALSAWVAAFAAARAAPATPPRAFFGPLGDAAACEGLSDGDLARTVLAMARLPPRRQAIDAIGAELERRLALEGQEQQERWRLARAVLPWLSQLLRRGLPSSCAACVLRAALEATTSVSPQDAWAMLLALRPLVPWAGEEEAAQGRQDEAAADGSNAPEVASGALASSSEAAALLLPRPEWIPPWVAKSSGAESEGEEDEDKEGAGGWPLPLPAATAANTAAAAPPPPQPSSPLCPITTTIEDVASLANDLARRLTRQARRAPPPLRAAPPLPAGLAAAAADASADPARREAALRAAEDILTSRLDQLRAALPHCQTTAQVLAACEGAVRALASPPLLAAAARSPRCRASAAALLRALEAAAFCEAAGALDLAQRLLLLRALDALRWAANAHLHVGVGGAGGGAGGAASTAAAAAAPAEDDAFSAALRRDLARDLASEAPVGAVMAALGALAALRLPPPPAELPLPLAAKQMQQRQASSGASSSSSAPASTTTTSDPPPPGWDRVALLRLLVARVRALPLASAAPLLHSMAALGYAPPRRALEYALEPLCRDRREGAAEAGAAGEAAAAEAAATPAAASSTKTLDEVFAAAVAGRAARPGSHAAPREDAAAVHQLLLALGRFAENERGGGKGGQEEEGEEEGGAAGTPLVPPRALRRVLLAHAAASCARLGPRELIAAGRAARQASAPAFPSTPGDAWAVAWVRRLRACALGGQLRPRDSAEAALLLARLDWSSPAAGPRRHLAWERQLWQALEPSRKSEWGPLVASAARARLGALAEERRSRRGRCRQGDDGGDNERRALLWAALKHGLAPQRPEWARAFVSMAARATPAVPPHVAAGVLGAFARSTFASLRRGQKLGEQQQQRQQERLRQHVARLAAVVASGAGSMEGVELVRALRELRAAEAATRALAATDQEGEEEEASSLPPLPLDARRALLGAALAQAPRATNPPPAVVAALLDLLASGPLAPLALLQPSATAGADARLARAWVDRLCALAAGGDPPRVPLSSRADWAAAAAATDAPFFPPWAPQSRRWKRTVPAAALLRALRASPALSAALLADEEADGGGGVVRGAALRLLATAAGEPAGAAAAAGLSDLSAAVTSAAFLELARVEGAPSSARGWSPFARPPMRPRAAAALLPPSAVLAAAGGDEEEQAREMLAELAAESAAAAAALPASPALSSLASFGRRAASWSLLRALSAPLGRFGRAAAASAALAARGRLAFERAAVEAAAAAAGRAAPLLARAPPTLEEEADARALWAEASRAALEVRLARLLREAVAASSARLAAEAVGEAEEEERQAAAVEAFAEEADADEDEEAALVRVFSLGTGGLVRALDLRMASLARRAVASSSSSSSSP